MNKPLLIMKNLSIVTLLTLLIPTQVLGMDKRTMATAALCGSACSIAWSSYTIFQGALYKKWRENTAEKWQQIDMPFWKIPLLRRSSLIRDIQTSQQAVTELHAQVRREKRSRTFEEKEREKDLSRTIEGKKLILAVHQYAKFPYSTIALVAGCATLATSLVALYQHPEGASQGSH